MKIKQSRIARCSTSSSVTPWSHCQSGFAQRTTLCPSTFLTARLKALVLDLQQRYIISHLDFDEDTAPAHPKEFVAWMNKGKRLLFSPDLKSTYSPNLRAAFGSNFRKAQLVCRFINDDHPLEAYSIDVTRAYTANLRQIDHIPRFILLDDFQTYGGEPLEDYNLYIIHNPRTDVRHGICANRRFSLISGMVLRRCIQKQLHYTIISYIRPCHVEPNPLLPFVEELYSAADMPDMVKKLVPHFLVGMAARSRNTNRVSAVCTDHEEACELGTALWHKELQAYVAFVTSSSDLVDGFMPLGFLVWDLQRARMLDLYDEVESAERGNVLGISTTRCLSATWPVSLHISM